MLLFVPQFDPISDAAEDVYDSLVSDLFTRMQPLSFQDKLGVSQRLFAAIDEYVDHFRLHIFSCFFGTLCSCILHRFISFLFVDGDDLAHYVRICHF